MGPPHLAVKYIFNYSQRNVVHFPPIHCLQTLIKFISACSTGSFPSPAYFLLLESTGTTTIIELDFWLTKVCYWPITNDFHAWVVSSPLPNHFIAKKTFKNP